jgi:hypothetical protein
MATRRSSVALLAAVVVAATAVVGASAARSTTTPGVVYPITVTVTDKSIVIQRDKFSLHSPYPRYPRGALIRYMVTNKGSRPYSFKIWGSKTIVMRPRGGHDSLEINWSYRGTFPYLSLYRGKPVGPHGHVTIF